MAARQESRTFSTRLTIDLTLNYLLYLPQGYGKEGKRWPLVLFLHGAGERGTDIELVKKHGPPKLVESGKAFPFILLSPQCPIDEYWSVPAVKALLDQILETHTIDRSRIYLTGMSMGGNGTWRLAMKYPDLFAAVAPVCGWGDPERVSVLKNVPAWVFHGMKDPVVPFSASENMATSLKAAGGNVRFTAYPEAAHDSWTETYQNPEFFEWVLKQQKGG